MRILCLIDYLCPGGAQRQLTTLAQFFKRMGHDVSFVTYHEHDFFRDPLEEAQIPVHCLAGRSKLGRVVALRKHLKSTLPDAVLAFLEGPCFYAEVAGLPSRRWGLIVSERLSISPPKLLPDWKRLFHHLADYVTANSHANRLLLERTLPRLQGRIATIYNCLDLSQFKPPELTRPRSDSTIRLVTTASYQARKNTLGLIKAAAQALHTQPDLSVSLEWYGGIPFQVNGRPDTRYFNEAQQLVCDLALTDRVRLYPAERNILPKYQAADAVILPSFVEGLPNTVCEGMACGRPILASRIGDAARQVEDGRNGFLFDPDSTDNIAKAILRFCKLPVESRAAMGVESRRMAEALYAPDKVAKAYEALLEAAAARRRVPVTHWPA